MSRVVRIEDGTYERLQLWSVPLEDTPGSVIDRLVHLAELVARWDDCEPNPKVLGHLLDEYSRAGGPMKTRDAGPDAKSEDGNPRFDVPPKLATIGGVQYPVRFWYDLPCRVVEYALERGNLRSRLPIRVPRGKRYYVSSEPRHPDGQQFRQAKRVGGVYVEVHYNAKALLAMAKYILRDCGLDDGIELIT